MRKINQAGLDLIKKSEGLRLTVYRDVVGMPTVGYGHANPNLVVGHTITEADANTLLDQDLISAESAVMSNVKVILNDNQFAALVDFVFNLGAGSLIKSTLLKVLNTGDYTQAASEFIKWNHAGGKVIDDLTRRREAETILFNKIT